MTVQQADSSLDELKSRIADATLGPGAQELGRVIAVADGLAQISGLPGAGLNEVLEFPTGARGFVLALEEAAVQAAFLDSAEGVAAGDTVTRTGRTLSVPVGEALLSRVVDPLGHPLDEMPPPEAEEQLTAERDAPTIIERDFVSEPLETGILVVDALFAVGRGQRELIIGERQTGKTAIAVDAIVNQTDSDVICIYVAIGQRMSAVRQVIEAVRNQGAAKHTVFVVAESASEPGLRWLAPFSATSMAEWFRDRGAHVLIVYDDLSKHAATHRELALLARQPPGREAYPGDIFYLHARLLERSGKLSAKRGGGSITALPIAEIDAGNLSAYIPTNLISISDGQIVTSAALFAANQRPAVDVGLSVSRVGGKAQRAAMQAVAGRLRLDFAQYLEMKMFSRFGGFGDSATASRLIRGERIAALLTQARFAPLPGLAQIALLAALNDGLLDSADPENVQVIKTKLPAMIAADPHLAGLRDNPDSVDESARALMVGIVRMALAQL